MLVPSVWPQLKNIAEMAGNIIPAIATTNAMTAGLCVLQSFKVLQQDMAHAKTVRHLTPSHYHPKLTIRVERCS
jgi:hypothetical protein